MCRKFYFIKEKEIFTKIIDQFPVGVAMLKFKHDGNPYVDYCNETIKDLFKL